MNMLVRETYIPQQLSDCGGNHSFSVIGLGVTDGLENRVKVLAASVRPETRSIGILVLEQLGLIHLDNKTGVTNVLREYTRCTTLLGADANSGIFQSGPPEDRY